MRFVLAFLLAAALAALTPTTVHSQAADSSTIYALAATSDYEIGCFGPCACPVLIAAQVRGTFVLTPTYVDPLFQHFAVTAVDWKLSSGQLVRGSGTYKVGGEFAVQQQMVLDLAIGNGPPLRYDSGLQLGGGSEDIRIRIQRHPGACFDTSFVIDARAVAREPASVPPGGTLPAVFVGPNPFHGAVRIIWSAAPGLDAHVSIVDASGRLVRALPALEAPMIPWGPGTVRYDALWDGRSAQGAPTPPGVYWVRFALGSRAVTRPLVRLR
jgi:hypothetical protein